MKKKATKVKLRWSAPYLRETGLEEVKCLQHGVGHPTKRGIAKMTELRPKGRWGIHGCCGCCREGTPV